MLLGAFLRRQIDMQPHAQSIMWRLTYFELLWRTNQIPANHFFFKKIKNASKRSIGLISGITPQHISCGVQIWSHSFSGDVRLLWWPPWKRSVYWCFHGPRWLGRIVSGTEAADTRSTPSFVRDTDSMTNRHACIGENRLTESRCRQNSAAE